MTDAQRSRAKELIANKQWSWSDYQDARESLAAYEEALASAENKIQSLRMALEYYAEPNSWAWVCANDFDRQKVAREALGE